MIGRSKSCTTENCMWAPSLSWWSLNDLFYAVCILISLFDFFAPVSFRMWLCCVRPYLWILPFLFVQNWSDFSTHIIDTFNLSRDNFFCPVSQILYVILLSRKKIVWNQYECNGTEPLHLEVCLGLDLLYENINTIKRNTETRPQYWWGWYINKNTKRT
jgi:hypothetical protein